MHFLAPFLIGFVGVGFGATFSLGKLLGVSLAGLWLALGGVYYRRGDWRLLAYLAAVAVTTVLSVDPWTSIWGLYGTYQCGLLAALVLVPFWACVEPGGKAGLVLGLRWGSVLMSCVGLLQLTGHGLLGYPLFAGHRVFSTIGSPVYLGAVGALCFPFCETWLERCFLGASLIASGSRGAWLACGVGSLYLYLPRIGKRARLAIAGSIALGLLAAFALRPMSDLGRVLVWKAAAQAYLARPFAGWGTGNFYTIAEVYRTPTWNIAYSQGTQDYAHNLFLEAISTSGLLGLFGLSLLLLAMWDAVKQDRASRSALLGIFLCGMLNPLPLIGKALAISIAAANKGTTGRSRSASILVRVFACNIFFACVFLIYLDRMMTVHGQYAWSFSSEWAAYLAGVIRYIHPRG